MNDNIYGRTVPNVISNEQEEGEISSPTSQAEAKQPYYN